MNTNTFSAVENAVDSVKNSGFSGCFPQKTGDFRRIEACIFVMFMQKAQNNAPLCFLSIK